MPTANFTLTVHPGTDALHRVVCICRRRDVQILSLSYADECVRLTVTGAPRQMRGIERWLAALVHVLDVQAARPATGERSAVTSL
jgi:hypothetical protein